MRKLRLSAVLLLALAVSFGAIAPSMAATPSNPYGVTGSGAQYPKVIFDWFENNVIGNITGAAGGFLDPKAPFDTPIFNEANHPPLFANVARQTSTSLEEAIEFIESLPKDYLRWDFVGNVTTYDSSYVAAKNLGYPVVVISKGPNGPVFDPEELRALGKPIFYVHGAVHGWETTASEAALSIMKRLAYDEWNVLDKISAVIALRFNLDGSYWFQRGTNTVRGYNNWDMNRDGSMLLGPQTRLISTILNAYRPHMALDGHDQAWNSGMGNTGVIRTFTNGTNISGGTGTLTAQTIPSNTAPGAATANTTWTNKHYMYTNWLPIDLGNKFHNTPQVISDWQDKTLEAITNFQNSKGAFNFPYMLSPGYTRVPVTITNTDGTTRLGDMQQIFKNDDCMPDEGYGDGMLGLKMLIEFCAEVPSSGSNSTTNIAADGYKSRMYGHFSAMETQIKFLAENAREILADIEGAREWIKTDRSDLALWNWQTPGPRTYKVLDMSPNRREVEGIYSYTVPYYFHNKDRKAGKTITRAYAYIIDPEHVGDGRRINADLAAFRIAYTGIPVYRLAEEVTVSVEGQTVGTIQSLTTGNSAPTVSGYPTGATATQTVPTYATFDADGNYTGPTPTVTHGDINTTFLGANDTASSFGLQSQRIVSATTRVETKTFPAGSYVVPVYGDLTNWANLHASFILEVLGKRNMGNSYNRLRTAASTEGPFYNYRDHYFPVAAGSKFPAYRYMEPDFAEVMKLERVFAEQPFMKGANFGAGFPVNFTLLGDKVNLGEINEVVMAYHFRAEDTALTVFPIAKDFEVMVPSAHDGSVLKKWYAYDWAEEAFIEAIPEPSPTSGAKFVSINGPLIANDGSVILAAVNTPLEVLLDAWVEKLNGNKNNLYITVMELYPNGAEPIVFEAKISIDNNAAGTYQVGPYKVYVDTKGNVQIRACYIVQ